MGKKLLNSRTHARSLPLGAELSEKLSQYLRHEVVQSVSAVYFCVVFIVPEFVYIFTGKCKPKIRGK